MCEPFLRHVLHPELCEQVRVPRESRPDHVFRCESVLFIELSLPLQIGGEVVVVGKYEAFLKVRFYFGLDLVNLVLRLFFSWSL